MHLVFFFFLSNVFFVLFFSGANENSTLFVCMNLLHAITAKRETSPALKKLQASCEDATSGTCPVTYSKEELKEKLNPVQYHVTQEKGTERYVYLCLV